MTTRAALATAVIQGAVVLVAFAVAHTARWRQHDPLATHDRQERPAGGADVPAPRDAVIDLTAAESPLHAR
jgi:hypothetical protein